MSETLLPELEVTDTRDPKATARAPRGAVKISDTLVPGWIDFEVVNNTYFEADTFTVRYSATALARAKVKIKNVAIDAAWLMGLSTDTFIEILAIQDATDPANPAFAEMTSLIYGRIDSVDYDPAQQFVTLTGRDLAGAFIDNKNARTFVSKTASNIAIALAAEYNLSGNISPTQGYVGEPGGTVESTLIHDSGSDWDLLCLLARRYGFVCYVSGQTLFFQPEQPSAQPYEIHWESPEAGRGYPSANVKRIEFTRELTITKGVAVVVMSSGYWSKNPVIATYPVGARSITPGKASAYGPTTVYTYTMQPGTFADQALAFAEAQYKRITSHAMKLTADLPGDDILFPRNMIIRVGGTGTPADQTYYPGRVTRRLDRDSGYTMQVEAQNFTPNLAAAN